LRKISIFDKDFDYFCQKFSPAKKNGVNTPYRQGLRAQGPLGGIGFHLARCDGLEPQLLL